ncbi:MAG: CcmD family protein [Raineya sp.]|nr:CcmD family protein [Raineya sp.]
MKQRIVMILAFVLANTHHLFAQGESNAIENFFRTESKFYVVVAVLAIVMIGLLLYVVYLDRKTKKLEKEVFGDKNPFLQEKNK